MNKKIRKFLIIITIILSLFGIGFFALIKYYQGKIPYNTWINGIYCTGRTYDEVAALLLVENPYTPELNIIDAEGYSHKIKFPANSYSVSYRKGIEEAIIAYDFFDEKHIEITPTISINEEKLMHFLSSQSFLKTPTIYSGKDRLEIIKKDDGFHLIDANEFTLDIDKAKKAISESIQKREKILLLYEKECYYTPEYSDADNEIKNEYIKLLEFCNIFKMDLTINNEIAYTVNDSVLKDWILIKKDGSYNLTEDASYQLDKAQVKAYAKQIAKETTTYFGKPWIFKTHNGEIIEVKAGNYGRSLKTEALYNVLLDGFSQGKEAPATYELEFNFYPKSAKDIDYGAGIGDSYIEVDISGQKVYLYSDGECIFESDCVTGDIRKRYYTPKGVFYIEYKQRNRVLIGRDYRTPVSYWMHFYNHCGFHDAYWRKSFGGDIYLNDGSHGCVNMPPEKAKEMYELAYKDMPVIVY